MRRKFKEDHWYWGKRFKNSEWNPWIYTRRYDDGSTVFMSYGKYGLQVVERHNLYAIGKEIIYEEK